MNVDKRTGRFVPYGRLVPYGNSGAGNPVVDMAFLENNSDGKNTYTRIDMRGSDESRAQHPPPPPSSIKAVIPLSDHPCKNFAFPPPPPPGFQRPGPRRKF